MEIGLRYNNESLVQNSVEPAEQERDFLEDCLYKENFNDGFFDYDVDIGYVDPLEASEKDVKNGKSNRINPAVSWWNATGGALDGVRSHHERVR
jgi:hypothetical protein